MKKLAKILFFSLIAIVFVSYSDDSIIFAQEQTREQTREQLMTLFNEATELFQNGNYNQANEIYDQILDTTPNNISTLNMKGQGSTQQRKSSKERRLLQARSERKVTISI